MPAILLTTTSQQRLGSKNTKTNTETPINPLLTVEDVAKILGVCTKTIRRMVEAGDITSIRVGRQIRFSQDDLERFIKRNRI